MDEAQFKLAMTVLIAIVCLLAASCVILAISYAMLANRLSGRLRQTVTGMETLLSQSIAEAARREELELIPPMRIELSAAPKVDDSAFAGDVDRWLCRNDFRYAGTFEVDYDGEIIQTYLDEDNSLIAALRMDAAGGNGYVEFIVDLGGGERGGVSNPPAASIPPSHDSVGEFACGSLYEDFDLLGRMCAKARGMVLTNHCLPIAEDRVGAFFEEAHAAQMDWRVENGGVSEQEIADAYLAQGATCTPNEVRSIQLRWQKAIDRHILTYSRTGVADSLPSQISHPTDTLLVVHDNSIPAHLEAQVKLAVLAVESGATKNVRAGMLSELRGELSELLQVFDAREAMARFRPRVADRLKLELMEQLDVPVPTDVYRVRSP